MADAIQKVGFGMGSDNVAQSGNYKFGGNFGKAFLAKFEFTPNGGKDGAPMEALDIIIKVGGSDKSYRMFPPSAASKFFGKNNAELVVGTPEWKAEFNNAMEEFNNRVTHILKCFKTEDELKTALSVPIADFKSFASVLMRILPTDYASKPLDIFLQWQWKVTGTSDKTFLEIPTKMKYGKWICAAIAPVGEWKEVRNSDGLKYIDDAGNTHPFTRGDWFMNSAYAAQQKEGTSAEEAMGIQAASTSSQPDVAESDNTGW